MIDLDDDTIARALNLEHAIDFDTRDPRTSIILSQLSAARGSAIEAMRALIEADPMNPRAIMALQNDVARFRDLVTWLANARTHAAEAWALLPHDEQQEVLAFLNPNQMVNDA